MQVLQRVLHAGGSGRLPHVPEAEARVVADGGEHVRAVRVRVEVAHRLPGVRALHAERSSAQANANVLLVLSAECSLIQYKSSVLVRVH